MCLFPCLTLCHVPVACLTLCHVPVACPTLCNVPVACPTLCNVPVACLTLCHFLFPASASLRERTALLPDGRRVINIRSETAGEKALFRESLRQHRCVVPASHYFEWERRGGEKTKYAIGPSDGSPLFMAGLYRTDGNRTTFAIMTREPAQNIAFIHDRMPVILSTEQAADWLDPSKDAQVSAYVPPVSCRRAEDGPEQLRMDLPGIG